MKKILFALALVLFATQAIAQVDQAKPVTSSQTFGDYTVHFSVFNSTFITPDVAKAYQLTRGSNRVLVNVSVTKTDAGQTSLGLPARVTGTATNLIQQQRVMDFKTISEGDATYYIASVRHTNEETINFAVDMVPEGTQTPLKVNFTRTLYVDR